MELVLNLDKIQSESVSQYAKDILDNQNPYKNFKIENYNTLNSIKKSNPKSYLEI